MKSTPTRKQLLNTFMDVLNSVSDQELAAMATAAAPVVPAAKRVNKLTVVKSTPVKKTMVSNAATEALVAKAKSGQPLTLVEHAALRARK